MNESGPLSRSPLRYGIAVVAVVLAVLLRWGLVWACGELPVFITFFLAMCIIAMTLGGGPAAVVTVLSVVAAFTAIPASGRLHLGRGADLVAASILLFGGAVVSLMAGLLERSRRQLAAAAERRGAQHEREVAMDALKFLVQCGCAPGEDFFRSLARYLAQCLGMDFVCIDRLEQGCLAAQTLAVYFDGKFEDNVAYALKDTPCGDVVGKSVCCFPEGVRHRFPKDVVLQQMLAESYVGTTLWGSQGQPIGLIAVIGRQPLASTQLATSILQLVAVRAAGELERRQAEEQLRAAHERLRYHVQNSPLAVVEFDASLRVTAWSDGAQRIFGWEASEVLGQWMWDVPWIFEEDREKVKAISASMQDGSAQRTISPNRNLRKDGSAVWCEWYNSSLTDSAGKMQSILSLVLDVTRRQQALEDATRAKVAAESASRAKDQFIAILSHELRTPLTPALAAVSMMETDERLPHDTREDLAMVRRNIALEVRLIADLLDVSRIISGKMHLEKRPVDVADTIRQAARIVSGDLDAKGQTLTIETPEAPYLTFGDAARLQQVFWNLLRNAIKFTPHRGRIAIRASVATVDHCPLAAMPCPIGNGDCPLPEATNGDGQPCGGNLIVQVSDNGAGIDPAVLPRLFAPFEQGDDGRGLGGLGLGLSICKAVVEMHGGAIAAHSDGSGAGATFTVRLPVAQCALPVAARWPPVGIERSALATGNSQLATPLRILLVEDHADTARLMRRLLMADGHEVMVAGSVADALAAVDLAESADPQSKIQNPKSEMPFDLLISDLGLPDGTGHELMRHLVQRGKRVPGIALSGYGTPADIEKSMAVGFAEHLVKPINPDLLFAAIQRIGSYQKLVRTR